MKIELIKGSSRGLGHNIAMNLAKGSYHIVITYKDSKTEALNLVSEIEDNG